MATWPPLPDEECSDNRQRGTATVKAQEVLRRYAAGERSFCNANLRGANFKGQDLSGADFSGADIRSASFKDAVLWGVEFAGAKSGLQRRWVAMQWLLIAVLAVVAGVLQGFIGAFVSFFLDPVTLQNPLEQTVGLGTYLLLVVITYVAISLQGFSNQALGSVLIAFASAGAAAVASVGTGTGAVAGAVTFAVTGTVTFAVAGAVAFTVAIVVAGAFSSAFSVAFAFVGTDPLADTLVVVVAIASFLFSLFVGWRVLKEDEKFDILMMCGLALAAVGGTSFCGADLTGANFRQAFLKSTNFANSRQHKTILTRVCWQDANKLNRARLGDAILQDRRVRTLLTTPEKGYKQDLTDANLRGANLKGVTLEGAILRRAVLTDALLEKAVLKDAILTEAQAINADFTGACLTGAILEAWNIDSTTTLKNIDCEYVFLREIPDKKGNRDRLPHDSDRVFQPGDFEKLFREVPDEVRILIRNGIDPIAFRSALQKIMVENPGITQNSVRTLDKKGQDVLMTLQVPEGVEKSKLEQDWHDGYQTGLQAGKEAIQIDREKFERLAFFVAKNPRTITTYKGNKIVTGNDQSQKIDVKGNFSITANQSVVSLRDISGQVNNQIAQLGDAPTQAQLKDLLTQLQAAIKAESTLSEEDKAEALAEVKKIAEAGQSPQDGPMKNAAKRSLTFFKGMTVGLGETTKFVTACNGLLPAIALLFNL